MAGGKSSTTVAQNLDTIIMKRELKFFFLEKSKII